MLKRFWYLLLLGSLFFSSCRGKLPIEVVKPPTSTQRPIIKIPTLTATKPPAPKISPTSKLATAVTSSTTPAGCTVVSPFPTPGPTEESLFPAVSDKDWVRGPMDASVTIIEYSDFQ